MDALLSMEKHSDVQMEIALTFFSKIVQLILNAQQTPQSNVQMVYVFQKLGIASRHLMPKAWMNVKSSYQLILKKDRYQSHVQMVDVFWIQMNADQSMHVKEESSYVMMEVADEILIQIFVQIKLSLLNLLDFVWYLVNKSIL